MQPMTDRDRYLATMRYQPRDRCPICDFGFWDETIVLWQEQGLPAWVTEHGGHDNRLTDQFFGMDSYGQRCGGNVGLRPGFNEEVIEDRDDHEVFRQSNGVLVLRKKFMGSIPMHLGHTLTDRDSWRKHYLPKLQPDDPARVPIGDELRRLQAVWADDQHPRPRNVFTGSLFGWLRDWMGMEHIAMVPYDDPAWFEEMVTALADVTVATLTRLFALGARFDCAAFWEDMCYNAGPLLAPDHFKKYLVPQYQRITNLLHQHGCDIAWVDCDGKIDDLLPLWLDAGVNCMFPLEIGTWGADPVAYRQQYGKRLLMMGGFNKRILAQSPQAITAEVQRLTPLVEQGGFIPFCDHRVPPDVPLANYLHYLREARHHWGRDVNLKPPGQPDTPR